jgi:hypothetical protein
LKKFFEKYVSGSDAESDFFRAYITLAGWLAGKLSGTAFSTHQ